LLTAEPAAFAAFEEPMNMIEESNSINVSNFFMIFLLDFEKSLVKVSKERAN
jgi:hypothetical protein